MEPSATGLSKDDDRDKDANKPRLLLREGKKFVKLTMPLLI